jgi:hypothetical protein
MEAIARPVPQSVLPVTARIAGAIGAALVIVAGVSFAGHASEKAVQTAQVAITQGLRHVVLPAVEIVARRGEPLVAETACTPPAARM